MKKDKDKLKTDSNILNDLAKGMIKARKDDQKKKVSNQANQASEKWKAIFHTNFTINLLYFQLF